ncbi:MAG: hypothetical protein RIF36_07470 [Imperialibacter sp.]|uniref:hypothetical protein n=1 Tax=Imperialibacter sp. TaxID=2038411 RepID=UPI0032EE1791
MRLLPLILMTISTSLFGQHAIGDKYEFYKMKSVKLKPTTFQADSVPTLVYIKRNGEIYFRQSDIRTYIQEAISRDSTNKKVVTELLTLVNGEKKRIEIIDLLFEAWTSSESDSLKAKRLTSEYSSVINHLMEFIGADLIYEGKFMVYSSVANQFINKGLKGKWVGTKQGSTTYDFLLPDRSRFYWIHTSFVD